MNRLGNCIDKLGRLVFVGSVSVLMLLGCRGEPEPVRFSLGDAIPLGFLTLKVLRIEPVPYTHPPLNIFEAEPEDRVYAVHVRWSGLDSFGELDRGVFIESFLEDRLTIVDADGDRYRAAAAIPETTYYDGSPPSWWPPSNWVIVFHVPEVSHTFKLLIENPAPQEGEFSLAVVPLDASPHM